MPSRGWTRDELILAMNLYCQLPFGKLHKINPDIIRLAAALNRTPSSVAMKLCNLASLDPAHQQRGVKGLSAASKRDRQLWAEFHADWSRLAAESEALRQARVPVVSFAAHRPNDKPARESEPFTGATEATREVRVRLAQRFFRRSVL